VISVKNFSGFVSISGDGSWVCEGEGRHKSERHPDPVSFSLFLSWIVNYSDI
jgi:hypothetical protein